MSERHIFVLGLDPHLPADTQMGPWGTFPEIEKKVAEDLARAGRNGFPCTIEYVDSHNVDQSIAEFEAHLRAGKDKYVGLIFGAGIRTFKDPLPFEKAITVARKVLPADVPIMFNDGPLRHTWAIERTFGVEMTVD